MVEKGKGVKEEKVTGQNKGRGIKCSSGVSEKVYQPSIMLTVRVCVSVCLPVL